jgi:hypothetical protein
MSDDDLSTAEWHRLAQDARREKNWKRWGPYLSERQWGTVREDYSADGAAWDYCSHDNARSRAYRWGEDGLLGITDREGRLCFSLALWNERDPILKERLFGLTNAEGNHGEDVKECYFYLDSTPTHSFMRGLYKYPQRAFPYEQLIEENRRRGPADPEFEITDTDAFDDGRYFDVFAEYAKHAPDDLLIRIRVANRGPEPAVLHLLPTLSFRNTWSWGRSSDGYWPKPSIRRDGDSLLADHESIGEFRLAIDAGDAELSLLFTENETNSARLYGAPNAAAHVKDAFHEYLVAGNAGAISPEERGTKAAAHVRLEIPPGEERVLRLRLFSTAEPPDETFGGAFEAVFDARLAEADAFYASRIPDGLSPEATEVARGAYAGLFWSKQFYHYIVRDWLEGDPAGPPPPEARKNGRNAAWTHMFNRDVVSMPDKWEYPWYASWDLAFHTVAFADVDPDFAKDQIILFLREWYMHPNGQIPAYEYNFSDVNPPVHAWAAWRIYLATGKKGSRDRLFLERAFQKLTMNFTWWVNRKDPDGRNVFSGGFLGLDNIGVFDRSQPMTRGQLVQSYGTAWMAFYCSTMLTIALELAAEDAAYEDIASKFFEHYVAIVDAANSAGGTGLWEDEDGFYYDHLSDDGNSTPLRVRSLVGLLPLIAVQNLEQGRIDGLPGFAKRMNWFLANRQDLAEKTSYLELREEGDHRHRLLAIPSRDRLVRVLARMLDESEFLSPHGIRSLSRAHARVPYVFDCGGEEYRVAYEPGESEGRLFGGNSNWRGPIWIPINYLLIEALRRYHHFYGETLRVECPTGSGTMMTLDEVACELGRRLSRLFLAGEDGARPWQGGDRRYAEDPHWRDLHLFHEYFHGETGKGLGASHQTGWTAVVAKLLEQSGERPLREDPS